ncbi:MAG: HAMP domain-containing histidine kinase, partial [Candidatus Latescibacteria bacterium]|nr:HAMP domain-containing histidine kinase [Candidatus Latescibacterota bacterium]
GAEGLVALRRQDFDIVLTDLRMPEMDGIDLLAAIHEAGMEAVPVVMTAFSDVSSAVETMKLGAFEFLSKPVDFSTLQRVLATVVEYARVRRHSRAMEWKLQSMGQLAAGIAHEINTPIQYVGDNLRFLQDAFNGLSVLLTQHQRLLAASRAGAVPDTLVRQVESAVETAEIEYLSAEIPKAIQQSLEGIERVVDIVRAMREFVHPDTGEKAMVDLNNAIASTMSVARNEWKYVADLVTRFDPDLPLVPCLPGDFNQVVLNLTVNAAQAIAEVVGDGTNGKGTIIVSTRRDGDWAEVCLNDTGPGIPEDIRSKIFDPFFTTKAVGKGTGQGLAISRAIVEEKHGGTLTFETEMGAGTTFIIRLPMRA